MQKKTRSEIICRCNNVSRKTIEEAIAGGCNTLNGIFDETTAGIGPCGGSCRRKLQPMLDHFLKTGKFPEKIVEDRTGKVDPGTKPNPFTGDPNPPPGPRIVPKPPSSQGDNQ